MTPVPYLFFKGTAEEALRAYARIFGSPEPQIMRTSEAPEGQSMGEAPDAVMHGAVQVGEGWIYASDDRDAPPMAGVSIAVTQKAAEESRRIFDALAEGGEVRMPLQPTFWSPGFGMLTDRWGTRWMIDTEGAQMPEGTSTAPAQAGAG